MIVTERFEVRAYAAKDIPTVAALHYDLFGRTDETGHSVAQLGQHFLERVFYDLNLDNPDFFCDVATFAGEIVGFSVYTTDRRNVFRHIIRRHFARASWRMMRILLRQPRLLPCVLSNLIYLNGEELDFLESVSGWLILTGVKEANRTKEFDRRTGIRVAPELFDRMEPTMSAHGCHSWCAVVRPDNLGANVFLQRRGATARGESRAQGLHMRYYVKDLIGPEQLVSSGALPVSSGTPA